MPETSQPSQSRHTQLVALGHERPIRIIQTVPCSLHEKKKLRANHVLNGSSSKEQQVSYPLLALPASLLPPYTNILVPVHSLMESSRLSTA